MGDGVAVALLALLPLAIVQLDHGIGLPALLHLDPRQRRLQPQENIQSFVVRVAGRGLGCGGCHGVMVSHSETAGESGLRRPRRKAAAWDDDVLASLIAP
jgi:hypothetical protein